MALRIKFTKRATKKIIESSFYLEDNFSEGAAKNFNKAVRKAVEKIAEYPTIGRESPNSTLMFINMDEHRQIFYRTYGTTLSIVDVFDTRQNPEKRPK
jgi:plasmid stabilization system protein ParE